MEAYILKALEAVAFVNEWLAVEIELMLPVMVLVALIDLLVDQVGFKKKNTGDRLILFAAFFVGSILQYVFGSSETVLQGIKSALYLGSISAVVHYGVRDYLFAFFLDLVPWLFETGEKAIRKKVAVLFGVNMEKELLGEEGDEDG